MKTKRHNHIPLLLLLRVAFTSFLLSSCELAEGIFKTGMGFGIFLVLAVIGLLLIIISKLGKK